jgi:hypothetical protein
VISTTGLVRYEQEESTMKDPFLVALVRMAPGRLELFAGLSAFLDGAPTTTPVEEGRMLTALVAFKPTSETDCDMDLLGYFAYPVDGRGRYSLEGRPAVPPSHWIPTQADMNSVVAWLVRINARMVVGLH